MKNIEKKIFNFGLCLCLALANVIAVQAGGAVVTFDITDGQPSPGAPHHSSSSSDPESSTSGIAATVTISVHAAGRRARKTRATPLLMRSRTRLTTERAANRAMLAVIFGILD